MGEVAYFAVRVVSRFHFFQIRDAVHKAKMVQDETNRGIDWIPDQYACDGDLARADRALHFIWLVSWSAAGGDGNLSEEVEVL